jgi:hypothetical protein
LEEQVYVIEDGGRKLIPDPYTFEESGYRPVGIEYVSPELLNTIPLAVTCKWKDLGSGRCWDRTSDLCRVKAALSR